ncbi:hypothetical protein CYY_005511 [Polysphondylium violaceum]|uniref:Nuclear condensin complex subunit 3 C-terminal domain-containing protein n=1 Tax=Polysphondylium violaceum TaxID=133409 RepID=A0A8J4PRQ3_9MYCE|nr:hypothetical protein CYY_005511 [Polysphondylium violaceum]
MSVNSKKQITTKTKQQQQQKKKDSNKSSSSNSTNSNSVNITTKNSNSSSSSTSNTLVSHITEQFKYSSNIKPLRSSKNIGISTSSSNNNNNNNNNDFKIYSSIFFQLDKLLKKCRDTNLFFEAFLSPLKIFLVLDNNKSAINITHFLSKYLYYLNSDSIDNSSNNGNSTTSSDDEEQDNKKNDKQNKQLLINLKNQRQKRQQLYEYIVDFLITVLESKDSTVRLRSLQIFNTMINDDIHFNLDKYMNKLLFNNIVNRCQDRISIIRQVGGNLLIKLLDLYSRLKDVNEIVKASKDILVDELLVMLENDPNWMVRNSILSQLIEFKQLFVSSQDELIQLILKRTIDIKEEVRVQSYRLLSSNFKFDQFSKEQILFIISNGIKEDPSEKIKAACGDLLCLWFQDMNVKHWIYRFLESVNVVENYQLLETVLLYLFEKTEIPEFNLKESAHRELTIEEAFHCKLTCKYMKSLKSLGEERLEQLLPTLTQYRDILFNHLSADPDTFSFLLDVLNCFDMADEVGRSNLIVFLRELLKTVNQEQLNLLDEILVSLSLLHHSEKDFIVFVVEIIQDMMDPLEDDPNEERLQVLKKTFERLDGKIASEAKKIKDTIDQIERSLVEKQTFTLLKSSIITHSLLLNAKKCSNSFELDSLVQSVILPSIQHVDPEIREFGIKNLGIFCLHKRDTALTYLNLFEKVVENDILKVQQTCITVIFDILLVFGSPRKIPKETKSLYKVIRKYAKEVQNGQIKEICIQGFCKLLYAGIVYDPKILSFILLEYFATKQENPSIHRCLDLFFQAYAVDMIENKKLLFDISMDVFQTITSSPSQSPYFSINLIEALKYILHLIEKPINSKSSSISTADFSIQDCQPLLALSICQHLIKCFRGPTADLSKLLPVLKIDREKHSGLIERIYDALESLFAFHFDNNLDKFNTTIKKLVSKEYLESKLLSQSQHSQSQQTCLDPDTLLETIKAMESNSGSGNNGASGNPNNSQKKKKVNGSKIFDTPKKLSEKESSTKYMPLNNEILEISNSLSRASKSSSLSKFKSYFQNQRNYFDSEAVIDKSPKKPKRKLTTTTTKPNDNDDDDNYNHIDPFQDEQEEEADDQRFNAFILSKKNIPTINSSKSILKSTTSTANGNNNNINITSKINNQLDIQKHTKNSTSTTTTDNNNNNTINDGNINNNSKSILKKRKSIDPKIATTNNTTATTKTTTTTVGGGADDQNNNFRKKVRFNSFVEEQQ